MIFYFFVGDGKISLAKAFIAPFAGGKDRPSEV